MINNYFLNNDALKAAERGYDYISRWKRIRRWWKQATCKHRWFLLNNGASRQGIRHFFYAKAVWDVSLYDIECVKCGKKCDVIVETWEKAHALQRGEINGQA